MQILIIPHSQFNLRTFDIYDFLMHVCWKIIGDVIITECENGNAGNIILKFEFLSYQKLTIGVMVI